MSISSRSSSALEFQSGLCYMIGEPLSTKKEVKKDRSGKEGERRVEEGGRKRGRKVKKIMEKKKILKRKVMNIK